MKGCTLTPDHRKELKQLNSELMLNMLELAEILVERPSQYARRVEDMSLFLKNMSHLLNSLRPHQARSTMIQMLESQIQRRKEAVEEIRRRRQETQLLLQESESMIRGYVDEKQITVASLPVPMDFSTKNRGDRGHNFGTS